MSTRKATIEDILQLAVLFDLYRMFYRKDGDVRGAEIFLRERLLNNESVIFVAEEMSVLVDFTQLYPLFSSTKMKKN